MNLPVLYDAACLAVAEATGATLWTLDRRLAAWAQRVQVKIEAAPHEMPVIPVQPGAWFASQCESNLLGIRYSAGPSRRTFVAQDHSTW